MHASVSVGAGRFAAGAATGLGAEDGAALSLETLGGISILLIIFCFPGGLAAGQGCLGSGFSPDRARSIAGSETAALESETTQIRPRISELTVAPLSRGATTIVAVGIERRLVQAGVL
jgi:hypothetical protein